MIDSGHNEPEKNEDENTLTVQAALKSTAGLIAAALNNAPPPVCEMTSHLATAQGKGVRTVLLLNCAANADGLVPEGAVNAAAAVELFHMATLVHDDVIDDAGFRRGIPTLHSRFGSKNAVICGDYLLCMAMSVLSKAARGKSLDKNIKLVPEFTKALGQTCLGEINQSKNNRNLKLSIVEYLRIIWGKTSALFYVSAYAGAVLGDCKPKDARIAARIGRYLGMIFQIIDDLKDYEFSEEMAKKPVNNDISEGVVTLPLIFAMKSSPALRDIAMDALESEAVAKSLIQGVIDTNGLEASRQLAQKYYQKANRLLDKLENPAKRVALSELLKKALGASPVF